MVIITMTNYPCSLRGDLSMWLLEISQGVFVGKINQRVREELWQRIQENIKTGSATMVYTARNEQGMEFKVHNSEWIPTSFDGLNLMIKPCINQAQIITDVEAKSRASKSKILKRINGNRVTENKVETEYVVVDVETTGLNPMNDKIIEIGAILVINNKVESIFSKLIKINTPIPNQIQALTGISDEMLNIDGNKIEDALPEFIKFVGDRTVVSHNIKFDYEFIRESCRRLGLPIFSNKSIDTYKLSRILINDISNYKLETVLNYFKIEANASHRSIEDCLNTKTIYENLMKL